MTRKKKTSSTKGQKGGQVGKTTREFHNKIGNVKKWLFSSKRK